VDDLPLPVQAETNAILAVCCQLVDVVEKVAEVVIGLLNPVESTPADKIQEALKKRGFETAS
jgi:hypothetical protein